MTDIMDFVSIFNKYCSYQYINSISDVQLRNVSNGIQLADTILYRFMYSEKYETKENIVSKINFDNGTLFTRQSFDSKENNVPVKLYEQLLNSIREYYTCNFCNIDNFKLIAIDGTYTNDIDMNNSMNLGIFDVTNDIPIDICPYGKEGKNREVLNATKYIKKNLQIFKENIIVCDRGYFSYAFLYFLVQNGLKFIIRIKGNGKFFNGTTRIKKSDKDSKFIKVINENAYINTYNNTLKKTIFTNNKKKKNEQHTIEIKNDCILITNLNKDIYDKDKVLSLYKSRWEVEVFFKYIKSNFKFQHTSERNNDKNTKNRICNLIVIYMAKIIEKHYYNIINNKQCKKNGYSYNINKSNLVKGII